MWDNTGAVPRDQREAAIPPIDVARDALIARLNHYQLVASGLDAKSAAALAEAAAFKRRVSRHGDGVLAGLPLSLIPLSEPPKPDQTSDSVLCFIDPILVYQ